MERELYNTQNNSSTTKSDLPTGLQKEINEFKKSILGTDKISFTEYISKLISDSETNNSIDIKEVDEFIEKLNKMRVSLHKFIDILVDLRLKDKISGDGKETLFRLALIDSSIKNGLKLICSKYNKKFNDNFINNDFTDRVIQLEKSSGSNSTTITSNSTSTGKTTLASSNNNVNKLSAGDETVEIKDDNETNPVKLSR
ncbi:unnamed protein product [[Candida] boidinii]|nr:unnamed protein product [[Candida] boidinii]